MFATEKKVTMAGNLDLITDAYPDVTLSGWPVGDVYATGEDKAAALFAPLIPRNLIVSTLAAKHLSHLRDLDSYADKGEGKDEDDWRSSQDYVADYYLSLDVFADYAFTRVGSQTTSWDGNSSRDAGYG